MSLLFISMSASTYMNVADFPYLFHDESADQSDRHIYGSGPPPGAPFLTGYKHLSLFSSFPPSVSLAFHFRIVSLVSESRGSRFGYAIGPDGALLAGWLAGCNRHWKTPCSLPPSCVCTVRSSI
jgi:hypothetical protein